MKLKNRIKLLIACDGGAASGKTTAAKLISKKYKLHFLSSGLLYRYVSFKLIKNKNLLNKKKRYNYYLNGAIYLAKFSYIIKNKSFFSKNTIIFDMPEKRSIDIDTLEDLKKLKKIL